MSELPVIPEELRLAALAGPVVMVDELQQWGVATKGQAARVFGAGKSSSHMTVAGDLEALHAMAARIGMRRAWFQDHRLMQHYDLVPARRARALRAGALFVPARLQAEVRRYVVRPVGTMIDWARREGVVTLPR